MNRPILKEDVGFISANYIRFLADLEEYCDELENEYANLKAELIRFKDVNRCLANLCSERNETIQSLVERDFENSQYRSKMGEEILKLREAFDNACERLGIECEYCGNKEEWKEWCMSDETL